MRDDVRKNIKNVIKHSIKAMSKRDVLSLKELSNHTIHDASIYQDEYSTTMAVVIYSLYKIFDRPDYSKYKGWNMFYNRSIDDLKRAYFALNKNDDKHYERHIKDIFDVISKLDKKLKNYMKDVFEKARIHKASRLHEHGISVGRTAEILGISEWEVMGQVGTTGISDVGLSQDVKERLKFARSLFK